MTMRDPKPSSPAPVKDDPSHLKNLGSVGTTYKYENPDEFELETFENKFYQEDKSKRYTVQLTCPEFTSLCPKTGQPDFATIVIEYSPKKKCIETKSLKLYLFAWRNEGSFMETIVNRMLQKMVEACEPWWIRITGNFNARGGIGLEVVANYMDQQLAMEIENGVLDRGPLFDAFESKE